MTLQVMVPAQVRSDTWFGFDPEIDMQRTLVLVTLALFGALSAVALWQHGYVGLFEQAFESWAGLQVLVDLVIALVLVMVWMWRDARASGRNAWPWLIATVALGSFGPLGYLLTRARSA